MVIQFGVVVLINGLNRSRDCNKNTSLLLKLWRYILCSDLSNHVLHYMVEIVHLILQQYSKEINMKQQVSFLSFNP